ncbi:(S)-2-hydroxy-acid oxidase [Lophium mytilinum]|uniref:(S)-2-hydroxy-acid oxidase n=1 Tax=Lophium mytilinum TaxID=390894 RepID=A0A6A6QPN7_9PEZI|nr:(S)-2-hydroxy-acid oxidase [Lophium mytilinum]
MHSFITLATLIVAASAARPFLNEPDTGLEEYLGTDFPVGKLPNLTDIRGIPDFDFAARNYLNASSYSFYRTGAAGEWSYRNNLEAFSRVRWRPQALNDVHSVASTLPTKILGHNFSAPFFIAPATRAGLAHEAAESNLVKGAYAGDILYITAIYATLSIEQIAAAKPANGSQVLFQQLYAAANLTAVQNNLDRAKAAGSKAIVFTIDAPATSTRHRAARYDLGNANSDTATLTWALYAQLRNMTSLPIILKGITTVDDVRKAISVGAPAIYVSNHGGRQLDGSPSPLEVCLEVYENDPTMFQKIEIYADSGVRYGTDVLKLLALGVRAVGLGRPFMYANAYGVEGVTHLIELLKTEIAADAANAGIQDVHRIQRERVNWKPLTTNGF